MCLYYKNDKCMYLYYVLNIITNILTEILQDIVIL